MHKETLVAIIIGLILGLILTFGVYQWQRAKQQATINNFPDDTPAIIPTKPVDQKVEIETPLDGTITKDAKITVTGTGPANTFLAVFVNNKETIGKIDQARKFQLEVDLKNGLNVITVAAIDNSGNSYQAESLVFYEPTQ